MVRWTIECICCKKKELFNDDKDIKFAKWRILGWNIEKNEPICVCPKCEYRKK